MHWRPAILLGIPALLAAQGQTRWYVAYEDGLAAQAKGDHRSAIAAFNRALHLNPKPGRELLTYGNNQVETYFPYLRLAQSALALGDLAAAEEALRKSAAYQAEPASEREALRQSLEQAKLRAAAPPPANPLSQTPAVTTPVPAVQPQVQVQTPAQTMGETPKLPAQVFPKDKPTQPGMQPSPSGSARNTEPRLDPVPQSSEPAAQGNPPLPLNSQPGNSSTPSPQGFRTWLPWAIAGMGLLVGATGLLWARRKKRPRSNKTPYRIDLDSLNTSGEELTLNSPSYTPTSRITGGPEQVGPYRITRVLGRGGCATAYLAVDERDGSEVAVKIPHPHILTDSEFLARFRREAALGALLDHPRIVRILDAGPEHGEPYLAMTFVRGVTLENYLRQHGALPVPEVVRIAWEVTEALTFAHAKSIVHRDLKPANLMLGEAGAQVMDFGIARVLDTSMTSTNMFIGTPTYAAPEALVSPKVGPAADRYALGIMLFEMLTGRAPFLGDTAFQILEQHRNSPLPDLNARCPGIPPRLVRLVERLTEKRPEERPEDGEVISILTELKELYPLEEPS